jgi:hypothetical protein
MSYVRRWSGMRGPWGVVKKKRPQKKHLTTIKHDPVPIRLDGMGALGFDWCSDQTNADTCQTKASHLCLPTTASMLEKVKTLQRRANSLIASGLFADDRLSLLAVDGRVGDETRIAALALLSDPKVGASELASFPFCDNVMNNIDAINGVLQTVIDDRNLQALDGEQKRPGGAPAAFDGSIRVVDGRARSGCSVVVPEQETMNDQLTLATLLRTAAVGAAVYHGYRRNDSVGWAIGWGFAASIAPVITVPVALAQGFGQKKR